MLRMKVGHVELDIVTGFTAHDSLQKRVRVPYLGYFLARDRRDINFNETLGVVTVRLETPEEGVEAGSKVDNLATLREAEEPLDDAVDGEDSCEVTAVDLGRFPDSRRHEVRQELVFPVAELNGASFARRGIVVGGDDCVEAHGADKTTMMSREFKNYPEVEATIFACSLLGKSHIDPRLRRLPLCTRRNNSASRNRYTRSQEPHFFDRKSEASIRIDSHNAEK
jgi:hypothetical protein